MFPSLTEQVDKLIKAGYPKKLVFSLIESCITGLSNRLGCRLEEETIEKYGPAVLSYLHRTAPNLTNVACRRGGSVAFQPLKSSLHYKG